MASIMTLTPLPSLSQWGRNAHSDLNCPNCRERTQTVRHVLSSCTRSLQQGRYTLRHDMVLRALARHIRQSPETASSHFDLAGERDPPSWIRRNDSLLRPDGWVLLKNGTEFILELTVPWEENYENAHQRKSEKYNSLLHERRITNPDCN